MRRENIHIFLMLIVGAAAGIVIIYFPALRASTFPPLVWILMASLAIELVMMRLSASRGFNSLPTLWRVAGFIGAVLVYLIVSQIGAPLS